jgi:hypothetical protein
MSYFNTKTNPQIDPNVQDVTKQADTSSVYQRIAVMYDNEVKWDELLMGTLLLRRRLVRQAEVRGNYWMIYNTISILS